MAVLIDARGCALHIVRRVTTHEPTLMYRSTTRAIQVTVQPNFVEAESGDGRYFWSYTIEIANLGKEVVQLRSRHWRITDGNGKTEEVKGAGVVGKQPVLKPGEKFSYTSGCPLP